ncbi:MAG: DMT family transporter [Burkholderiaceae bacterium]
MSPSNWALLLVSAASFASSIILNKLLIDALPPFTLAAVRVVLALPFCLAALALAGLRMPRDWADRLTVIKVSLGVIVVPYCALVIGQQTIPGGVSGILYSTMPLFTLLAAHLMLPDEKLGWRKLSGIGLGMGGVVVIMGPSLLGGLGDHLRGELITLLGPLAYAIATVLLRRSRHLDPIALTAGLFTSAALIMVPVALVLERPWTLSVDPSIAGALVALAVFGTIAPAVLNYLLVQRVGATRASLGMFLMPFFAVAGGALFLGERLGADAFAGLALIVAGSWLVTRMPASERHGAPGVKLGRTKT